MDEWRGPILKCHELSRFYAVGDGLFALSGVEMEVWAGQFVVIMGPSGSGKSTLLNILGGIDRPSHGEVILCGRKYSRMSEDELAILRRTQVGMVFQFFNLLPELTAAENVGISLRLAGARESETMTRVTQLMEAVGLAGRSNHYPMELSGGEQQRVAIARALAPKPAVVLADEPTGNLDSKMSKSIMELFAKFNREEKQTFVVVTHEPGFQEYADTVIHLVDGEIKEMCHGGRRVSGKEVLS
ncbi:MAG: ABC transporter ATP-binding protein [Bacillota bacterium]